MKKLIIFVAISCICMGVYFGFICKPAVKKGNSRGDILPGIEFVPGRDENAADYYVKALASLRSRTEGGGKPESLTREERQWFMLGTNCRWSSFYPEHYPHVTDGGGDTLHQTYLRHIARLMVNEGRAAEEDGDVKRAMDIWRGVAVFGRHLESEKESTIQVLVGVAVEKLAYEEFVRYYRERGKIEEARRYETLIERLRQSRAR